MGLNDNKPDFISHCQHFIRDGAGFKPRKGGAEKEATRQIENWLGKQEMSHGA